MNTYPTPHPERNFILTPPQADTNSCPNFSKITLDVGQDSGYSGSCENTSVLVSCVPDKAQGRLVLPRLRRRRKGSNEMINVDEAYRIILENIGTLPIQEVNIKGAVGLCLAEDAVADIDMPPFDKSSMDGYAVIAEDTLSASGQPVELDVIEGVAAGQLPQKKVERGQATKIMTGAALPQGADAVIKVEDTEPMQGPKVRLLKGMKKGENVCPRGEDFQAGQVVLKRATTLRPQEIGILAMIGMGKVKVYSSPKVGISSTG